MTILHVTREGWKVAAESKSVTITTADTSGDVVVVFNELKGITKLISVNVVSTEYGAYVSASPSIKENELTLTFTAHIANTTITADIVVQGY